MSDQTASNREAERIKKELLQKVLHQKGWLKKKSPALLKSWQERYFMITNDGHQLAYFEDDKVNSKLKGAIDTDSIIKIRSPEKAVFVIEFPGRDFELKAKNHDECLIWMQYLTMAREHVLELRQSSSKKASLMTDGIKLEKVEKKGGQSWKDVDIQICQVIQAEKEEIEEKKEEQEIKKNYVKGGSRGSKTLPLIESSELLERIGINDYIKRMPTDFIANRVTYGYIGKRSKGKLKYFQKRWFILVSAKPLNPDNYTDEKILDESSLPPWMEIDTLYYFSMHEYLERIKLAHADIRPKGEIKMIECQELILKNMQKSKEAGFSFKINMGDRLFHLMTDTESERMKWTTALSSSQRTTKEVNNPLKIKLRKNIDSIVKIYDNEQSLLARREKLRDKIDTDFNSIKDDLFGDDPYDTSFENLLKFLTPVSRDMLETMNACVCKDPQRKDLIKEYIDFLHERICEIITNFWDNSHEGIESISLLKLSGWMWTYSEELKDFFVDDRLLNGIRTLLGIYINRSIESVESVIQGIVDYERSCEPFSNENDQLVTQAPVDLFKIINEGFDLAHNMCHFKETVLKLGFFARTLIQHYQTGVEELMDDAPLKMEQYIALCNNTIQLSNYTKQYTARLKSQGLSEDEAEKVFDQQKIIKKFVSISTIAKDKFYALFFSGTQKHFKLYYLELKIDEVIKILIDPASDPISRLHDSFSRKIWKQFLDIFVLFYFNCLIVSCPKAKKDHLEDFVEKLQRDKEYLSQEFEPLLFESQLTACLKPFDSMVEFLENDSISILEPCKCLRIFFGRAFNEKTIKNIMSIRFDLDKDRKKDTIEACRELLDDYNKHNLDDESVAEKARLVEVLGQADDEVPDEEEKKNSDDANRRQDITLDDFEEDQADQLHQQLIQQQVSEEEQKVEYYEEGYLYKKKPKDNNLLGAIMVNPVKGLMKNWDHRFVRLRKGYIYWYLNERSREAQNKLDLSKVDDIVSHPSKHTHFALQLEGGKKYKFKAENAAQRDIWVKSLIKEQQKLDIAQITKIDAIKAGEGKKPIIKDYDEIARKERQKQKAEERKRKRLEREAEQKRKITELKKQQQSELGGLKDGHRTEGDALEQEQGSGGQLTCWQQLMICLGVERAK